MILASPFDSRVILRICHCILGWLVVQLLLLVPHLLLQQVTFILI